MTKINRRPQDIVDIIAEHDAEIRRLRRLLTRGDTYATVGWVEDNFVCQPNGGGATSVQIGVASTGGAMVISSAGGATGVQVGVNAVGAGSPYALSGSGATGVQIGTAAVGAGEDVTPSFPLLRSVSTAAEVDSTGITITKPSGVVSGDLLVAFVIGTWSTGASWNTPSGWTARTLRTEVLSSSQATSRIFTKVAGSSEPTSYTFTLTGTMRLGGDIMAFANSSGVGAAGSNYASSQVVNGITTTAANSLLLMVSAVINPSTTALPAGMTSAISHNTDDNHRTAAYEERPTIGATGTRSFAGSTVSSHGHAIEVLAV